MHKLNIVVGGIFLRLFQVWLCVLALAGVAQALSPRSKLQADTEAVFAGPQVIVKHIKKLDTSLSMLAETHRLLSPAESLELAQDVGLTVDSEMVEVVVEPAVKGQTETISRNSIYALGGIITGESKSLLRVKLPISRLEEAASTISGIRLIRPPMRPVEHAVESEGVGLTNADSWHIAGYDGSGVKVAVIDGGFNGLSAAVSNGDIPSGYIGVDMSGTGLQTGSYHGTAVAEAVCDMAPGVQLYCIKIMDDVDFESAKDYCKAEGVDIINHSMGWHGASDFDGTGVICEIANDAVANGILWVNAAGNEARKHCQTNFTDSGNTLTYTSIRPGASDKPFTNFPKAAPTRMYVTYRTAGQNLQCFLTWDAWSETNQDYDLFLYKDGTGWILGSIRDQTAGDTPWEGISHTATSTGWYAFGVTKYSASRNHRLNLFVDSSNSFIEIEDALNRIEAGSCIDPAVSPNVFAAGAINRSNWASGPQENFSSQGPTNGGVTKPDISGPDNCNSYIYGYWSGTSLSSPHIAGAAALVKYAFPAYTNAQIRSFLENQAIDLGAPGKDNVYGWGKLALDTVPDFAPVITSSPVESAKASWLYNYDVDAIGIPAPVYSLTTSPTGMTINPSTGLIQWTPLVSQIGTADVVVEVDNSEGFDTQSFTITISPSDLYNVKDYGAIGDGIALDSPAVNATIEDANAHGGGTVYFPPGTYICGSIRLKSDIRLDLDPNAIIEAAPDGWGVFDLPVYNPYYQYQDWGHSHWRTALIWGIGLENVAITGDGLINGQTMTAGKPSSGNGDRVISLKECTGVLIEDIKIYRGGHFAIILTGCDNVAVNNVLIDTNRDATNFDCCKNVSVTNCLINSPGDDAICLKSSYALGYKRSTENVNIENCTVMAYDIGTLFPQFPNQSKPVRHGRIKFGTESNGGFKNINITNCHFEFCYGFMLATVDGGDIENINISDITMTNVIGVPIFIKLGNRARGPGPPPPGIVRNINIDNVTGNFIDRRFCNTISGIPGHYIEDVNLSNIDLQAEGGYSWEHSLIELDENEAGHPDFGMLGDWYPSYGFYCRHVKNIEFHDVNIGFYYDDERPSLICIDVNGLEIDNFNAHRSYGNKAPVIFEDMDNIDIHDCNDIEWVPSTYGSIWSSANKVITGEPFDISVEANSTSSGVSTTQMYIDSNYVDTEYVWLNADEWKDILFKDNYLYTPGLHKVEIADSVFYQGVCLPSDFNFDYRVDFADYAQLADDWLRQAPIATTSQEPVAWWKFDEGTGYSAYDSTLYRNTGSLINMSQSNWVSQGRFGGTLRFDGFDDYVYVPDHPSLNFGSGSFTFSAWLKTTQVNRTGYLIINGTSGGGYSGKRYSLRHKNSTLTFAIDDDFSSNSKSTASSSGAVINDGQWHHIVAIRDRQYWQRDSSEGRTKGLNIFVDGKFVGNGTDKCGDISSPGEPLLIGRDGIDFYGSFMNGTMDDIRLYNYALLKAEIATLLDVIYLPLTSNLYDAGDGMIDGLDLSVFMDDWLSCADDLPGDLENEGNFEVTYYKANVAVGDLLDAIDVYTDPNLQADVATGEVNVINLRNTGTGGHYAEDKPFPGTVMGGNVDDFVIAVEGTIDIPHSGQWTFGVNSDEGFYLEIDGGLYASYHLYNRSPADTFTTFDLPAGEHSLFMLFWDNTQGSELELFAAPGAFSVFDAKEFALVGDLLNGQISVVDNGP